MINKAIFTILLFSLMAPIWAQDTGPSPRDALITEIEQRAQQDVKLEKSPENIQGLNLLFGEEAKSVGLTLREVVQIYEETYQTAKPKKSGFEKFMENQLAVMGWSLAIIFFIFHFLREAMNKFVIHVFVSTKNWFYRQLSGYRFFRRANLRKYRQALIQQFQEFTIPFCHHDKKNCQLKLRDIYVPLKVKGTTEHERIDASQAITKYQRLMVVGEPGAGKSTLLKHLALSYAEGDLTDLPKQPVPILLDINRLNSDNLLDDFVNQLDKHDFPNARHFVEMSLEKGTLMLLFDGLDEVKTSERQRIVNKINDWLDKYSQCRTVITCRTAVYHNEFVDKTKQTLEIDRFRDHEIQQFLEPWQNNMPAGKSVKQLMHTLQERPRIMQLAGNPLMLTIIAYLYTDTAFVLPHSRAKFYSEATHILLEQWHREHNQYDAAKKQAVLRHLALFNQISGSENQQDRRSMDFKTVFVQIKQILPDLNLTDADVEPLLNEIVERSGLLQKIDGGERYQFAHLTLQEFFAAVELRGNMAQLLTYFQADSDGWRETVKIWCGLDHDSSELIRAIYTDDPIMAFECLADAQQMNAELADEITEYFKLQLGTAGDKGEAINRAFAAVASNTQERGKTIFDFLAETLSNQKENKQKRIAAANALSMTNLPQAAEVLGQHYHDKEISILIRAALREMGDLAVPVIVQRI